MKRTLLTLLAALALLPALADEGMWLPSLISERIDDMRAKGFRLTAEDIYSINKASMKDAVVLFNGGCTGELISPEGLLLTNHHCGYDAIQKHSTVEHDYLTNGFWAMSRAEELPNEKLWVRFLVRMEEVTDRIAAGETAAQIVEKAKAEGTGYKASVEQMYYGNQQFLFVYEQFDDVRLVAGAAIPSERCALGLKTMTAGKDYFTDKAPLTTLEQLADAKAMVEKTGKKYAVYYSERLHVESAVFAGQLVQQGAIGRVVQTLGMGPHREGTGRPDWFYDRRYFGGILLGAGGLVRAYAHGAKIAVDAAGRSIKRIWTNVYLPCPYSWYERIRLEVAAFGGMIRETQFGADVELDLLLPEEQTQGFLERVTDLSAGTIEGLIGKQEYRAFPLP